MARSLFRILIFLWRAESHTVRPSVRRFIQPSTMIRKLFLLCLILASAASFQLSTISKQPYFLHMSATTTNDNDDPCASRQLVKPDGREIPLAKLCVLQSLAQQLDDAIALDVRDDNEIKASRGGVAYQHALHVPVNIHGQSQSEHTTTLDEYTSVLEAAGILDRPKDTPFLVHCTGGGRASKVVGFLQQLGFTEAHNGGSPDDVRQAFEVAKASEEPIERC